MRDTTHSNSTGPASPEAALVTGQRTSGLSASLTTLLKFGGAATALGLLVGWLYQQGLMDGMDLPAAMFPTKLEDLLFMTYVAAIGFSTSALKAFGENLLLLGLIAVSFGLVVGLVLSISLLAEERLGIRGWATRFLQRMATRRFALGLTIGVGSGVGTMASLMAVCMTASLLVLVPMPAYFAGKEEGTRLRSITQCTSPEGVLLHRCAEVVFQDGERIVGVYLAGTPGFLALRVGASSTVYTQPVKTIRFGSRASET